MRTRRLVVVTALVAAAGCATGGVPRPFPTPGSLPPPERPGVSDLGTVVATALDLRGAPYRSGGADPAGFDCSGFVAYVFGQHGVTLPRTVAGQFRAGRRVRPRDLQPGDLLFFSTSEPGASHVAIALSGGRFVHAPSSRGEVRVERLSAAYWHRRFVGARRVF